MKKTLALLALYLLAAACHERKTEPRPDYGSSQSASDRAHDALDKEAKGGE